MPDIGGATEAVKRHTQVKVMIKSEDYCMTVLCLKVDVSLVLLSVYVNLTRSSSIFRQLEILINVVLCTVETKQDITSPLKSLQSTR